MMLLQSTPPFPSRQMMQQPLHLATDEQKWMPQQSVESNGVQSKWIQQQPINVTTEECKWMQQQVSPTHQQQQQHQQQSMQPIPMQQSAVSQLQYLPQQPPQLVPISQPHPISTNNMWSWSTPVLASHPYQQQHQQQQQQATIPMAMAMQQQQQQQQQQSSQFSFNPTVAASVPSMSVTPMSISPMITSNNHTHQLQQVVPIMQEMKEENESQPQPQQQLQPFLTLNNYSHAPPQQQRLSIMPNNNNIHATSGMFNQSNFVTNFATSTTHPAYGTHLTPLIRLPPLMPVPPPYTQQQLQQTFQQLQLQQQQLHQQQTQQQFSLGQFQAASVAMASSTMMTMHPASIPLNFQQAIQHQQLTPFPSPLTLDQQLARIHSLLLDADSLRSHSLFTEAVQRYNEVLYIDPLNTTALNCKGHCHKSLKEFALATECYQRAVSIAPHDWIAMNNLGILYKEMDMFEASIEHYARAIQVGPSGCVANDNMSVVQNDLATRYKLSGQIERAIETYHTALKYHAGYWPAYFNLGVIYSERFDYDRALQYYNSALERNSQYSEALCNVGVIYKNRGQTELAMDYYRRALQTNPNFGTALNNIAIATTDLGTQLKHEGKTAEGIECYKKALFYNSKYPAAWYNLGVAYVEQQKVDEAKLCYEMAVLFDKNCAEAFNNLGVIYKDRGNLEQAVIHYNQALVANPSFSQTLNNLGVIYTMLGKLDEALDYCTRAIAASPTYGEAHNNLGVLYRDEGRIEDAIKSYNDCLRLDPLSKNASQNRLLALNSICHSKESPQETMDYVYEAHREWGQQLAKAVADQRFTSWPNTKHLLRNPLTPIPSRPIRIGYISADFFTHSVSYFIEAPIHYADPKRTFVVCYANVARRDKKTQLLQNYAHAWRSIHDKTAQEVAQMVREDEIDILIELTGHTAGNRLDVMALKPAPVQVTWIGYPNTTGLPTIDYRFTDDIVDPLDTKQKYTETLVRLPGPFLCYQPPSDAPPVSDTPALHRGYVTFGSFNNLAKINDELLNCWCAILSQVPNSRMLMKCKPFASPTVVSKMRKRFVDRGIDAARVQLVSLLPSTSEHLAAYSNIDISIDTFPYAGTTTTCEALYMGVPVVTYQRENHPSHAHNVSGSLISRIPGAEILIAKSQYQYIQTAVLLASDIPRLQQLRQHLRPAMLQSPLCDGPNFVRGLEDVYESLWAHYCNQPKQIE